MNISPSAIFPIFRSDLQGKILARVLLNPEQAQTVSEIVAATNSNIASVLREVNRLTDFGIFQEKRRGRNRYISAATEHQLYIELRKIVEYSFGPMVILPQVLTKLTGVSEAYIYGSWAERESGIGGHDPNDIDVLIVGRPNREQVYQAAREAERSLGKEVNIRIVDKEIWESAEDVFLSTLRSKPLVQVV